MFQRQTRQAFPARFIFLLAAAILGLLYIVYTQSHPSDNPRKDEAAENGEENEKAGGGLWPAEWFYAVREYPDFKTSVGMYESALKSARQENHARPRGGFSGFSAPWQSEGPGNIGARINTIEVDPSDPDVIYIGYSGGGLWKTVNGGLSWEPVFDDQPFLSISDIELDPNNSDIIYAGTGDENVSGYPFIGNGIWKSTDGGANWEHLGLTEQRIVSKIIVDPSNSNIIYVATMGLPFERNNQRGLYKSTNGGASWQQVLFVSDQAGIIDMVMSPADPQVLYATSWDRIRSNKESVTYGSGTRVWKTADGGANWTVMTNGLPEYNTCRIGLSIDAQNANHVVAMYSDTLLRFQGIYETFNAGQSWQLKPLNGLDEDFQSNFAWYFGKIRINPFNSSDIYACGVTVWRTQNSGATWFQTTPDWWTYEVHADAHDVAFINATTVLLATDGGLYRSTDNGNSWIKIENIPASQFYRVAYNPHQPENYYGGMQDNGTSGGNANNINDWPRIYGGDGFQPVFHPNDPEIYYVETQNGNIAVWSQDEQWYVDATEGIDPDDRRHWDMQYIMSKHDPNILYTGTYRVYSGSGIPTEWGAISDDLTDGNIYGARYHTISTLDESAFDFDLLFVGTTDGNVWRGVPFANEWTNITAGLPDRYVSSVKVSPSNPDRVFVTHTGYKDNDFTPLVHRSDDKGNTWVPIAGDLPQLAINDIYILPGYQDSIIVVATDGGVWATHNSGVNWERLGTGMPYVPVYDLEINPAMKTLFAGTHARSIYSFPLDSLTGNVLSTKDPNSFLKPRLTLSSTLVVDQLQVTVENIKSRQSADVMILDLSGRLMWQRRFNGGAASSDEVPVGELPAGAYVIYARTEGNIWGQKKFVVAR